ncbi:MAG: YihY/virulence factor BrkB family protein, partial [Oscillospiraceae bacterium]
MVERVWNAGPVVFVRDIVDVYFDQRVSRSAAELAYFLILTFFPILICVNAFVGSLHLDSAAILQAMEQVVPKEAAGALTEYLRYITDNQSTAMLIAGITMTLFPASAAFRALMNIMDDIYGRKGYTGIWQVVASVVFSVLFLITIYLSLIVLLTGNWFFHVLEKYLHIINLLGNWQWLKYIILFALVLTFILLVYRLSAPRGKPRPPVLTGGILAAAALVAASMLFSYFIGLSSKYSLVYGSLASVIILLVWLYLCGNILILGNVVNYVWYTRKKEHYKREHG